MYSQYLGKDKVVGFAQPIAEDIEVHALADHDEIAEMMRGPRNHIPPVSSRPYTLVLKHHRWVQDEIETLKRAGVITKSMSPWASSIVVVPKKSQPREPPKKRL